MRKFRSHGELGSSQIDASHQASLLIRGMPSINFDNNNGNSEVIPTNEKQSIGINTDETGEEKILMDNNVSDMMMIEDRSPQAKEEPKLHNISNLYNFMK